MWFQKSRTKWISSGDRNTKYFHRTATIRKQRNKVTSLVGEDGNWVFDDEHLRGMALNFFSKMYIDDNTAGLGSSRITFPVVSC